MVHEVAVVEEDILHIPWHPTMLLEELLMLEDRRRDDDKEEGTKDYIPLDIVMMMIVDVVVVLQQDYGCTSSLLVWPIPLFHSLVTSYPPLDHLAHLARDNDDQEEDKPIQISPACWTMMLVMMMMITTALPFVVQAWA